MEKKDLEKALDILNNHGVIAFPTETVMGLGILFDDEIAYHRLSEIKRRPADKPYTLMLSSKDDITKYAFVTNEAKAIINAFVPGPVTLLLKVKDNVPNHVTLGKGIIGVRVPDMKETIELLKYVQKPLLVPSANKASEKPAMSSKECRDIFNDEIDYIVEGEALGGLASTIIDLTDKQFRIIREGPVKAEDIKKVLEEQDLWQLQLEMTMVV